MMPVTLRLASIRLASIILVSAFLAVSICAATFTVRTTLDTQDHLTGNGVCADNMGRCSLRAAITESNALAGSDIIIVSGGTYTHALPNANENSNAGGDWDITGSVQIVGQGVNSTFLQAKSQPDIATERVIEIVSTAAVVSIEGVTVRYGKKSGAASATTNGGGLRNLGTLTLNSVNVEYNKSPSGGGIYSEGPISLGNVNALFNNCESASACSGGNIHFKLRNNTGATINASAIGEGRAGLGSGNVGYGGGIAAEGLGNFSFVMTNTSVYNNGTVGPNSRGGGLSVTAAAGVAVVSITGSEVFQNSLFSGTGGLNYGAGVDLSTSGSGTISGTVERTIFEWNKSVPAVGGGLSVRSSGGAATVTVRQSSFSNNAAMRGAGAAVLGGPLAGTTATLNLANSTFINNSVENPDDLAGPFAGGAVYVSSGSLSNPSLGKINLDFCTLAENRSSTGGGPGLYNNLGTANIKNTVFNQNGAYEDDVLVQYSDIKGTANSQNYNHFTAIPEATITGVITNNTISANTLEPFQIYPGILVYFYYYEPLNPSPAYNAIPNGTNGCGTTVIVDQRGTPRPYGLRCEKGAIELQ